MKVRHKTGEHIRVINQWQDYSVNKTKKKECKQTKKSLWALFVAFTTMLHPEKNKDMPLIKVHLIQKINIYMGINTVFSMCFQYSVYKHLTGIVSAQH